MKTEYFSHGLDLREPAMRAGLGQLLIEFLNGDKFVATATLCQVDSKDRAYLADKIGKTYLLTACSNICRRSQNGAKEYASKLTFLLGKKANEHGTVIGVKDVKSMKEYKF